MIKLGDKVSIIGLDKEYTVYKIKSNRFYLEHDRGFEKWKVHREHIKRRKNNDFIRKDM